MNSFLQEVKERIGCVISLGTGIAPITKITLNQTKIGHLIKTISKYGEYLKNMVTVFIKQVFYYELNLKILND